MRSHHSVRAEVRNEVLAPLVGRAIEHEGAAWQRLWLTLDPGMERIAGRWRLTSRLSSSWDDRRNIVVRVMSRLQTDDFRRLRSLHGVLTRGEGSGWAWIAAVTRRAAINYTRDHDERVDPSESADGSGWAGLLPLSEGEEDALPESCRVLPVIEAHEIQAYAEKALSPPQLQALRGWLMGYEHADIADKLRLADPHAADLLVRAATKLLRRRVRGERGGSDP